METDKDFFFIEVARLRESKYNFYNLNQCSSVKQSLGLYTLLCLCMYSSAGT